MTETMTLDRSWMEYDRCCKQLEEMRERFGEDADVEDDDQWIATAFDRPAAFMSDPANSNPNSPEVIDPLVGSGRFLVEAAGRSERRKESD